jgi:hypothetical protein
MMLFFIPYEIKTENHFINIDKKYLTSYIKGQDKGEDMSDGE